MLCSKYLFRLSLGPFFRPVRIQWALLQQAVRALTLISARLSRSTTESESGLDSALGSAAACRNVDHLR